MYENTNMKKHAHFLYVLLVLTRRIDRETGMGILCVYISTNDANEKSHYTSSLRSSLRVIHTKLKANASRSILFDHHQERGDAFALSFALCEWPQWCTYTSDQLRYCMNDCMDDCNSFPLKNRKMRYATIYMIAIAICDSYSPQRKQSQSSTQCQSHQFN